MTTAQDSRNASRQRPFPVIPQVTPRTGSRISPGSGLNASGIRFRGSEPSPPAQEEHFNRLRRNIDSIRRQIEQHRREYPQQRTQEAATTSFQNPLVPQPPHTLLPQEFPWQRMPDNQSNPLHLAQGSTSSTDTRTFTMPANMAAPSSGTPSIASAQIHEELRTRLHILQAQIAVGEDQLNRGHAPTMEDIIQIRTQLFGLLDERYRNPLAPRDGVLESLLSRVFNMYTRADQIRVTQARSTPLQNSPPTSQTNMDQTRAPLHLITSPDGYQGLAVPPGGAGTIQTPLAGLRPMQSENAQQGHGHPGVQPNPDAAVLHNVVRQAVVNQQANNQAQLGFARNLRRVWLFVRLYFFCYMFSDPGTWTRIILVTMAVLGALLSETDVPHQLYRAVVTPVQRHFESLVHFGPRGDVRPGTQGQATGHAPAAQEAGHGLRNNIRRVERSVALFLASLVPGVGERHVEARHAEEAAERVQEEEQRRQEENQGETNTEQTQPRPEGQGTADNEHDTPVDENGERE